MELDACKEDDVNIQNAIKKEYKTDFNIFITGGYGKMLSSYFDFDFTLDNNLILKGISIA